MHPRQKFIFANWKMHTTASEAQHLAKEVVDVLN
jgi:triosephosphate isomerase